MSPAHFYSPESPQRPTNHASSSPPATPPYSSSLFSSPPSVSSASSIGTDSERPYTYPILVPACFGGEESLMQSSAMNATSSKRNGKRRESCRSSEDVKGWSVRSQEADYEPLLQCVGLGCPLTSGSWPILTAPLSFLQRHPQPLCTLSHQVPGDLELLQEVTGVVLDGGGDVRADSSPLLVTCFRD